MYNSVKTASVVAGFLAAITAGDILANEAGAPSTAAARAGDVTQVEGRVFHHKGNAVRGQQLKNPGEPSIGTGRHQGHPVHIGDSVRSKRASSARLILADDSRVILKERSTVTFHGIKKVAADKGIILFDIRKQGQAQGLKVVTKTAVIGVKGTRFLVDASDDTLSIYLSEGNIAVQSVTGEFKRHRQQVRDEAAAYYEKQRDAYQEYLKGLQQEFVEYVKEFEMKANSAIVISNQEVRDIEIPQSVLEEFKLFDQF